MPSLLEDLGVGWILCYCDYPAFVSLGSADSA